MTGLRYGTARHWGWYVRGRQHVLSQRVTPILEMTKPTVSRNAPDEGMPQTPRYDDAWRHPDWL